MDFVTDGLRGFVLGVLIIAFPSGSYANEERKNQIVDSYESYREAVRYSDGQLAADLMASKTLRFFEKARELALYGNRKQLLEVPFIVRMYALLMRGTQGFEVLESADAKDIFINMVSQGAISIHALDKVVLKSVEHSEYMAKITFSIENMIYPEPMIFVFEEHRWRFHLYGFMKFSLGALEESWVNAGVDTNHMLMTMVENVVQRPVSDGIWDTDPDGW
ncbi:hypothetical protein A9Q99_06135 [Gammaproteobacteria bacterium 45_16_T64]|nr:hypothetical protein A9Q99_06135 [Gammaproteobacteria bacterium 45_16_T64]